MNGGADVAAATDGVLTLVTPVLEVGIDVASGGRLTHLLDRVHGEEWLVAANRPPESAPSWSRYEDGPRGGLDECLPSVGACPDPNPQRSGIGIGDHGDFWCSSWSVTTWSPTSVRLRTADPDHPLELTRSLTLDRTRARLRIAYSLVNRSRSPYDYLYSLHPLIPFDDDLFVEVPSGSRVVAAFGPSLHVGSVGTWPWVPSPKGQVRFDRIPRQGARENVKVFVGDVDRCLLKVRGRRRSLELRWDAAQLPWLGVCVNRGAWPSPAHGEHWVALEPTTSPTDSLDDAVGAGAARRLAAGGSAQWSVALALIDRPQPAGQVEDDS